MEYFEIFLSRMILCRRAAEFLTGTLDDEIQADVAGFVRALLDACDAYSSKPSR